ncbi:transposase [Streptomyces tailanensis]|uniref:transposase n=1 Tax=Streptomyces tailanensis TaxID=2569858 RepID=UPI003CCC4E4B
MPADLVPDDLWERVAPLLPPAPERRRRHPGRLRVPDRTALAGVMYVLRNGVAWRDVSAETVGCSGVTTWRQPGDWPRPHAALLGELRRAELLDLDDCAVDGPHVRPPKTQDPSHCPRPYGSAYPPAPPYGGPRGGRAVGLTPHVNALDAPIRRPELRGRGRGTAATLRVGSPSRPPGHRAEGTDWTPDRAEFFDQLPLSLARVTLNRARWAPSERRHS